MKGCKGLFLLISLLAIFLLASGCSNLPFVGGGGAEPAATPSPTPAAEEETADATATATRAPSPTLVLRGTPTPVEEEEEEVVEEEEEEEEEAATPAPEGLLFGEITFCEDVDLGHEPTKPVNPGTEFPASNTRVYAVFTYEDVLAGTEWTQRWVRDGDEDEAIVITKDWAWGTEGTAWIFVQYQDGWTQGDYELVLSADEEVRQRGQFTIE